MFLFVSTEIMDILKESFEFIGSLCECNKLEEHMMRYQSGVRLSEEHFWKADL